LHGRGRPAPRELDEPQAAHGSRLLPRHPAPQGPAGARTAHAHQCAHTQGSAPRGDQDERAGGQGLTMSEQKTEPKADAKPDAKADAKGAEKSADKGAAKADAPGAAKARKKVKRQVSDGVAHVHASF